MKLTEKAKAIKRDIPAVFLAMRRSDTPIIAKIFAGITVCYALSPIDLIPDFIPILGYLDDIILLPALIALTMKLIPSTIFTQCRMEAENLWKDGKPRKWYYAIPILLLWLLIIWLIVKTVFL